MATAKRPKRVYSVGLLLHPARAYMREVLEGVYQFVGEAPHWRLVTDGGVPFLSPARLHRFDGDGLIGVLDTKAQLRRWRQSGIPVVNTSARTVVETGYGVVTDSRSIGRLAAEHLLRQGLQHLATCGHADWKADDERFHGFSETAALSGAAVTDIGVKIEEWLDRDGIVRYRVDRSRLATALKSIPAPCGVFAVNSAIAAILLETCLDHHIQVPQEVAVIGVGDDPLICHGTTPRLSTVLQPSRKIGYQAAQMLDLLLRGHRPQPEILRLQPQGVAERTSTNIWALNDLEVVQALKILNSDHGHTLNVSGLLKRLSISRRALETKFQRALGHSPGEEIRHRRIAEAKRLLVDSSLSVTEICFRCGFSGRQVFSAAFVRETGVTPREWRRRQQGRMAKEM